MSTQVRLAEHLATQRQTAAGYDTFFSLVEKALLSPDLDRFRRDYLQVATESIPPQPGICLTPRLSLWVRLSSAHVRT
jgi:hypothetical protein